MTPIKTATLTFHAPNNNGSFLQAYALQKVLKVNGIDNIIINFYSNRQMEQYSVFRKPRSIKDIIRNVISLLHYSALKARFIHFQEMRDRYLNMTIRITKPEQVYEVVQKFDAIICGSDQIWNTAARDFSNVYFLLEIKCKKITYAVSCGSHLETVDKNLIVKSARDFYALSVRESATLEFFKEKGLVDTSIVLDPSLLLKKNDYDELYCKNSIIKGKYIFLYTINYDSQVLLNTKHISERLELPVYAAFTGYSAYKCKKYGIKVIYDMSPDKFLNLIDNATYVCTNSFHGVAFSIIFQKQFYRLCNADENGVCLVDNRIDEILNCLDLMDRNTLPSDQYKKNNIDYKLVEPKLEKMVCESKKFLFEALRNEG
jgi:hypothetical protein